MWVSANQRIPLSVLARNLHKGLVHEISYETGRRRGKLRSQGSQQIGVSNSQKGSGQKKAAAEARSWGLGDPEARSASARG